MVSQSQQAFYCRERKQIQIKNKFVSVVKKKKFYIPLNPYVLWSEAQISLNIHINI